MMGDAPQDTNRTHQHPTQTDELSWEGNLDLLCHLLISKGRFNWFNKLGSCDLSCGSENIPLQQPD